MSITVVSDVTAAVWKIEVSVGDHVAEGDDLVILEAMKMEIPIEAEVSGTVTAIHVAAGDSVNDGQPLVTIGQP
ncbi:biotin/lipoyl-binding carrier protein [Saccharomonospora sp. NPDC046836]|uniref:biotin/lipoyl-binding carrier protein n=1 Tax=Saccharomonospora sp. NPDC046836 TaxID=3156921 RepID=UPI003408F4BF